MKTVQQHLRELDTDQLLREYLFEHPIEYRLPAFRGLSVSQIEARFAERLRSFIEHLKGLGIKDSPDGSTGIIFACRRMDLLESGSIDYILIYAEEALREGLMAPTYAYDFSEQAELMGFLVADNEFTQRRIYQLMSDILYEASFFGFDEEYRDEALNYFNRAIEDIDEGRTMTSGEPIEMFQSDYYAESEKEDSEERILRTDAERAVMKYNEYCRNKELEQILLQLNQKLPNPLLKECDKTGVIEALRRMSDSGPAGLTSEEIDKEISAYRKNLR